MLPGAPARNPGLSGAPRTRLGRGRAAVRAPRVAGTPPSRARRVIASASSSDQPKASPSPDHSAEGVIEDIKRLSVFTVTANPTRRNRSIGWSATEATAPECTFEVGQSSSGIAPSSTRRATGPSVPSAAMSSAMWTPCPIRSAPWSSASSIEAGPNASPAWIVSGSPASRQIARAAREVARRVPGLGAGQVEPDHALRVRPDGEPRDLLGAGAGAHRVDQRADHDPVARALLEAGGDGRDDLVGGEAAREVLLGGVADLGVDDAVVGQVLGALAGHARERLGRLHHADRVGERLEVQDQVLAVGAAGHPRLELVRVGRSAARRSRSRRRARRSCAGRTPPSRWSCKRTLGIARQAAGASALTPPPGRAGRARDRTGRAGARRTRQPSTPSTTSVARAIPRSRSRPTASEDE